MDALCKRCRNQDCTKILIWFDPEYDSYACFYKDYLEGHPSYDMCLDDECDICSVRDCPRKDPLHHHHDGCPSRCDTP